MLTGEAAWGDSPGAMSPLRVFPQTRTRGQGSRPGTWPAGAPRLGHGGGASSVHLLEDSASPGSTAPICRPPPLATPGTVHSPAGPDPDFLA